MKASFIIAIIISIWGYKNESIPTVIIDKNIPTELKDKSLIVIDQDYDKALEIASLKDKLIFIDFYTSWCGPCKKLDKLVFQNDSIKQILQKDIVLLKYNAENDSIFHLAKKHHVSSYPTGLILNKSGFVLNRKYGFPGENLQSLSSSILKFTNEGIALNKENKILRGYSNKVDISKYPKFYADYINRSNTKVSPTEINDYLNLEQDIFSEEYFSTLLYFASDAADNIADTSLKYKEKYLALYGKTDTDILFYFLTRGKFSKAISEQNQDKYNEAVLFAKSSLSKEWTDDILPSFEKQLLLSQNKWEEVFEINDNLKQKGELDNGYINHFSWQVYKKCDDQNVIKKCLDWMKTVTTEEPTYAYLDTYAHLMFKSGNKDEARIIALLTMEAAKTENESTKGIKKLIDKL